MGNNLELLKNKFNAELVFYNEGENIEKIGNANISEDALKQIVVVLKQSLDTAECNNAKIIEFYDENKKLAIVFKGNNVYGFILDNSIENIEIEEDKKEDSKKSKVVLKERKKIKIKGGKDKKEEIKEEKSENVYASNEIISKYNITSNTFKDIGLIAAEYLEDFAEDIINNLIKESKIDKNNVSSEGMDIFLKKLNKSSSLIIGPSHANEMINKIKQKLTE